MLEASPGQRSAFTLIELLIVIAIIAILALIAVPNFLEAQVRSKVSRCMADMRSLGMAIEAYTVDYNFHPLDEGEFGDMEGELGWPTSGHGDMYCQSKLTTPVAYITGIPTDPFVDKTRVTPVGTGQGSKKLFDYVAMHSSPLAFGIEQKGPNNQKVICYTLGYRWVLKSPGPSRSQRRPEDETKWTPPLGMISGKESLWLYDPTNGTVSFGYIVRTNKGNYEAQDYEPR